MMTTARLGARAGRPLTNATLAAHAAGVDVPTYDRAALRPAVVHIGVGGFHRAHQGVYFDDLAQSGASTQWGVTGVNLLRRGMRDALAPQDCLYTVLERDAGGERARVIGAMRRSLFAPHEREAVLAALSDPRTRLVTLTVTAGGYNLDPVTGDFDHTDPAVRAELEHPQAPDTAFGYIVEGLARRRRAGVVPFTVLSCDNIPDNGTAARTAVVSFARLRDDGLARWIEEHTAFPASMVDRITPETTPADRDRLADRFGVADRWPVVTEPFMQWVVEDTFSADRPPLEEVGVQIVADVAPYRLAKTRLLNASHCALGYLGTLAGHRWTGEAMADSVLRIYVEELMAEIAPLVPDAPGVDLAAYRRTVVERLGNPEIGDCLSRLCGRGSTKMPAYLLPSLTEALAAGRPHGLLALAVAGWMRYLRGTDMAGAPIEICDARRDRLAALAVAGGDDPRPLLSDGAVFGTLADDAALVGSLERALQHISRYGPRGAIRMRLGCAPEERT